MRKIFYSCDYSRCIENVAFVSTAYTNLYSRIQLDLQFQFISLWITKYFCHRYSFHLNVSFLRWPCTFCRTSCTCSQGSNLLTWGASGTPDGNRMSTERLDIGPWARPLVGTRPGITRFIWCTVQQSYQTFYCPVSEQHLPGDLPLRMSTSKIFKVAANGRTLSNAYHCSVFDGRMANLSRGSQRLGHHETDTTCHPWARFFVPHPPSDWSILCLLVSPNLLLFRFSLGLADSHGRPLRKSVPPTLDSALPCVR